MLEFSHICHVEIVLALGLFEFICEEVISVSENCPVIKQYEKLNCVFMRSKVFPGTEISFADHRTTVAHKCNTQIYFKTHKYISQHTNIFQNTQIYFTTHKYISKYANIFYNTQMYFKIHKYISKHTNKFQNTQIYFKTHKYISKHTNIFPNTHIFLSLKTPQ